MDIYLAYPLTQAALRLLARLGFHILESEYLEKIREFHSLCSTWNLSAKLMSTTDLSERFDEHIADSLSLAAYLSDDEVAVGALVDIGTGGGFPCIPLCLLLPELRAVGIERSETKATFLRQAKSRLAIENVEIIQADFPRVPLPDGALVYTARAVEDPAKVDLAILKQMKLGDTYLAQRRIAGLSDNPTVTVEILEDDFTDSGLRRGELYRIQRQVPRGT